MGLQIAALRGFGGFRGLGSATLVKDAPGGEALQLAMNRFTGVAGFTSLIVDGDIGENTRKAGRLIVTWLINNGWGNPGVDWIVALSSNNSDTIAAEASRYANILDGIANSASLPAAKAAPSRTAAPVTFPDVSTGGRLPGSTTTMDTGGRLPDSAGIAPAPSRTWMWAGLAAAAAGVFFLFGRKKR